MLQRRSTDRICGQRHLIRPECLRSFGSQKAYDTVRCGKLRNLLKSLLSSSLSSQLATLFCPTSLQARLQRSSLATDAMAGVPQGNPISPLLFDLFMDPYLEYLNNSESSVACCFAEDLMYLSMSLESLQDMLTKSTVWSGGSSMRWNVAKTQVVRCEDIYVLQGSMVSIGPTTTYLGVTVTDGDVLDGVLLSSFEKVQKVLGYL